MKRAFWALLGAWWTLSALLAWWQPIHGSDWARLAEDAPSATRAGDWLAGLLAGAPALHALVAASASTALLVALTTHALARLPRPERAGDALALLLTGALVWLTVPGVGATLHAHASVGQVVVGLAALAWLLAAYRLADDAARAPRSFALVTFLLGGVAGACVGPAALVASMAVAVWLVLRRRRRAPTPAWMWLGLAGLCVGLGLAAWSPATGPRAHGILLLLELDRFARKAGEAQAIPALLAFVVVALKKPIALRREQVPRVLWLAGAAVVIELCAVFLPSGGDAALLPALAPFVVVSVILLDALAASDRVVRGVLVAGAVGVNLVAFALALFATYGVQRDFAARAAALAAAPAGSVATVPAYRAGASTWFAGEDLVSVDTRALVAARHQLTDVLLDRRVAGYQPAQPYPLRGDGATFVRHLPVARRQFLRTPAALELLVDGLDFPGRRGRPVLAARREGANVLVPSAQVRPPSPRGVASFVVHTPVLADEVYVIHEGAVIASQRDGQVVSFAPTLLGYHDLVSCAGESCTLVETMNVRP